MQFEIVRKYFFPLFVSLFGCCPLFSQQTDTLSYKQLEEIQVVEKTRTPVIREAAPVQLMDRSQFERLGLQNLSDAVKRFSGVTLRDYGGIGGLKTVSIRSFGAQHTAVSYDGITVSDPQSGQVDISRFSLDDVESVSLSIGQADDIFQTARMYASAGALSIRTEVPVFTDKSFQLKGQVKAGSFGLFNPALRYSQKINDSYSFTLLADWMRADGNYPFTYYNGETPIEGKRNNSDIKTFRSEFNFYADWKNSGNLRFKGYWFDSHRGLPGSVVFRNDYHPERLKNKNGFLQAAYENRLNSYFTFKGLAKFDYAWTRYQDFHDNTYEGGEHRDVYTQREYYGSAGIEFSPWQYVSFTLTEDFFVNTLDATIPKCAFPKRYTSLTAFAGQYKNSRLTITGSLLNTYIKEEVELDEPADDRRRLSPAVSVSYRVLSSQNLRVRASYKDIFRTPTFSDLYYDRIGNRELESEKARQYNMGITWSGAMPCVSAEYISLTVDGYYNQVKDKIVAIPTMFIWKMMNMGKVNIKGIDANLSARFSLPKKMHLQLDGSFTWQDATDATNKSGKTYGHQIPYTPVHTGNVSVALENPWVNVSWLLTAVGDRYSLAQNIEANLIKKYTEHQLSFYQNLRLNRCDLRLHAEILNIGNISYDVIRYYPMPGRSFRAGVVISY